MGDAAGGVHEGETCEVVPEGAAVLPVVLEEDSRGRAHDDGLPELGERGHVGLGPPEQAQVLALELLVGVAGHADEGRVRVGQRVLGRVRVDDRHSAARRIHRTLHEAQASLQAATPEQQLHALADEGRVKGLGQDLVGAFGEGQLHRALRRQPHDGDGGLVDLGQGPDARAHGDAVEHGQEGVEQHEVELEPPGEGQRLHPVAGLDHVDGAHVEGLAQEGAGGGVAGGDEQGGGGGGRRPDDSSAALEEGDRPELLEQLVRTQFHRTRVYTLESFHEAHWRYVPVHSLDPFWPLQMGFQLARNSPYHYFKRVFDLAFSGFLLVLFAPLFGAIVLLIWATNGRPAIFQQSRVARDNVPFTVYKFRTMFARTDEEAGEIYTRRDDPRITRVGRWLRKLRLDELPQLWNVFRGDMSLIGPRAEWTKCVERYVKSIPFYHFRHLVKPGITGWAQVNYPYGESDEDAIEKLKYDLYYIRNYSLKLDLMIVLKTVHTVLFGKGQ